MARPSSSGDINQGSGHEEDQADRGDRRSSSDGGGDDGVRAGDTVLRILDQCRATRCRTATTRWSETSTATGGRHPLLRVRPLGCPVGGPGRTAPSPTCRLRPSSTGPTPGIVGDFGGDATDDVLWDPQRGRRPALGDAPGGRRSRLDPQRRLARRRQNLRRRVDNATGHDTLLVKHGRPGRQVSGTPTPAPMRSSPLAASNPLNTHVGRLRRRRQRRRRSSTARAAGPTRSPGATATAPSP